MATVKPLVVQADGQVRQIADGDTIPSTTIPSGSTVTTTQTVPLFSRSRSTNQTIPAGGALRQIDLPDDFGTDADAPLTWNAANRRAVNLTGVPQRVRVIANMSWGAPALASGVQIRHLTLWDSATAAAPFATEQYPEDVLTGASNPGSFDFILTIPPGFAIGLGAAVTSTTQAGTITRAFLQAESCTTATVKGDQGLNGWTPILAVENDGERRVQRVIGWTGGTGTAPASGKYVGPNGFVDTAAEAADVRGASGQNLTEINDAQHGQRAGGNLHAVATADANGFMAASDFSKLAALPTAAELAAEQDAQDSAIAAKHGSTTVAVAFTPAAKDATQTISLTDAFSWPVGAFVNIPTDANTIYIAQVTSVLENNNRTVKVFQRGGTAEIPAGTIVTFGDGGFGNAVGYIHRDESTTATPTTMHSAAQISVTPANGNTGINAQTALQQTLNTSATPQAKGGNISTVAGFSGQARSSSAARQISTLAVFGINQFTHGIGSASDSFLHARYSNQFYPITEAGRTVTFSASGFTPTQAQILSLFSMLGESGNNAQGVVVPAGATLEVTIDAQDITAHGTTAAHLYASFISVGLSGSVTFEASSDGITYGTPVDFDLANLLPTPTASYLLIGRSAGLPRFSRVTFTATTEIRAQVVGATSHAAPHWRNLLARSGGTHYAPLAHSNLATADKLNTFQDLVVTRTSYGNIANTAEYAVRQHNTAGTLTGTGLTIRNATSAIALQPRTVATLPNTGNTANDTLECTNCRMAIFDPATGVWTFQAAGQGSGDKVTWKTISGVTGWFTSQGVLAQA